MLSPLSELKILFLVKLTAKFFFFMLNKFGQSNLKKNFHTENSALLIFFYLTNNTREEVDNLRHLFQQYDIHLERFKGSVFDDSYQNANFVA